MKYIIFEVVISEYERLFIPVMFAEFLIHKSIAHHVKRSLLTQHGALDARPISAGFFMKNKDDCSNTFFTCYGESTSLDLKSRGVEDALILQRNLNGS